MPAPKGYHQLPPDETCKCLALWREKDGAYWCCGAGLNRKIGRSIFDPPEDLNPQD